VLRGWLMSAQMVPVAAADPAVEGHGAVVDADPVHRVPTVAPYQGNALGTSFRDIADSSWSSSLYVK